MDWISSILSILGGGVQIVAKWFGLKNSDTEIAAKDSTIEQQIDVANTKSVDAEIKARKPKLPQ